MKLINQTKRCSSCGCLSLPDSRYCPKCGKSHIETGIARKPETIEDINLFSPVLREMVAIKKNIIINVSDNITISISDNQLIQIN